MPRNKKITVLFCYEFNAGGEARATKEIYISLKSNKSFDVKLIATHRLKKTNLFSYFHWIFSSVKYFFGKQLAVKSKYWLYTPTYTAVLAAIPFVLIRRAKIIFHYHGNRLPEKPPSLFYLTFSTQFFKFISTKFLHIIALFFCEVIIFPTYNSQQKLWKEFPSIIAKKQKIIPNGANSKMFYPIEKKMKTKLRNSLHLKNAKILLITGRMDPKKNIHIALKLMLKLRKTNNNIILLISYLLPSDQTEIKYEMQIREIIQNYNLQKQCYLLPNGYERFQPAELIGISDCVCSFSDTEIFPLILLESIACKIPFLSSNSEIQELYSEFRHKKPLSWKRISQRISCLFTQL